MKKSDLRKYRESFLHWKGWTATASFCAKAWRSTIHWSGWKTFAAFCGKASSGMVRWTGWKFIFALPFPLVLLLSLGCGLGLLWVFTQDLAQQVSAYFLFALSAYCLAALCVKLPSAIRGARLWLSRHPKATSLLKNVELRFRLGLYFEQFINFAYGIFKIGSGLVIGSAWIGCDGIYNMAQALIQLFQILRRKKAGTLEQQWQSYRLCGVLILLMHLTLTGIVFQMIHWNRAEEQGQIMVIATAAFAFYKITTSFASIVKDRKHIHPVDSSIRMLNLAQAIFAIFSLQASMIHTFGSGESWEHLLNTITGCAVCMLIVSVGVYMIRRGTREIRKIQENQYG